MGIYIKNMAMPRRCVDCWFFGVAPSNDAYCWLGHFTLPMLSSVPDVCPLVEVKPHGDLIDRDAVYKRIHEAIDDDPQLSDVYVEDAQIVTEWLRTEPTIIESEGEDGTL